MRPPARPRPVRPRRAHRGVLRAGLASAVALATLPLGLVLPGVARAATTATVAFSGTTANGTMTVDNGTSTGSVPAGTAYTGSVTYTTTATSTVAFGGGTHTVASFSDLTVTIGTSTVHTGPGTLDVFDDVVSSTSWPSGDSVYVNFTGSRPPSGPLAGAAFNWMGLAFLDATGRAVSGGAVPADLAAATWTDTFSEFNFGTLGTPYGAGNTSMIQPMTVGGTPPPVPCTGRDGVVTAFAPRVPGFLVVDGGTQLLDHLWTTDLTPATVTFLGGTTTFWATGLVVTWHGVAAADGCHLTDLTVAPPVALTTTSLPAGQVGVAYSAPVTAQWGVAPYAVTVSGLPAGLSFDGSRVVGTPTVAGTSTVTGTVRDARGGTASASWTLTVAPAAPPTTTGPRLEGHGTVTEVGPGYAYLVVGTRRVVWDARTVVRVHTPTGTRRVVDGAVHVGMHADWVGRRLAGSTTVLLTRLEIG